MAADELNQLVHLDDVMSERPPAGHSPISPPRRAQHSASEPPPSSALESLQRIVEDAYASSVDPASIMADEPRHLHNTVSPADVSKQPELEKATLPLLPALTSHGVPSSDLFEGSDAPPMAQPPSEQTSGDGSSEGGMACHGTRHVVTLPFQASLRPFYDKILREYKSEVTDLSTVFNNETYESPEPGLVKKIDELIGRLYNICDYPQDAVGTVLESLPPSQLAKYSCDANSKFNFLYELLHGVRKDTTVLVVARSTELLRLLLNLTEALGVECQCNALGTWYRHPTSAARVTLALSSDEFNGIDFNVVVAFDHSFGGSPVSRSLADDEAGANAPLVLTLVTTHSIEHIDLRMPAQLGSLERKSALLAGVVHSRTLILDPDRDHPEPHQLAALFVSYLNGEVDEVAWEPIPVPDEVVDIYLSSQARSQLPSTGAADDNGRKRKLVSGVLAMPKVRLTNTRKHDELDDEDVKRMRVLPLKDQIADVNEVPLPDDIRDLLQSASAAKAAMGPTNAQVKVPLAVLQALAEEVCPTLVRLERGRRDANDCSAPN